ncbi:transglycosylase SLT domain-containing protein [Aquibacillus koreensis]|uniref:Transglycosylase SLT domain-containing protein n=1 Tax=Aquibacillus koreensis TaxID=279446 RepID=A0A9X3WIB5_9BACI|nr:transglycosylase SLT domain-containing protein [Aquibacillus koreensis]MCT2537579.1 transglycosylase SLT domain-containing protein [Aquibacillus koreensis]MDC3419025.1 transglycosylase SLT domain-containing protein [Aquibacillus koreensis]
MIKILAKWMISLSLLTIAGVGIYHGYSTYKTNILTLEQENEQLKNKNDRLRAQVSYKDSNPENPENTSSYENWSLLEKKAKSMVEKSDGAFKSAWAFYLVKEAKKYDIDPFLVFELLYVETGGTFNPELVGPETVYGHAYGMGQFMKNTAPWVADMAELPYKDELLFDPFYSIQLSIVYLDFLHSQYENWDEALTAYHRGMGGLEQYKEKHGHAKSNYASKIQNNAKDHQTVAIAN